LAGSTEHAGTNGKHPTPKSTRDIVLAYLAQQDSLAYARTQAQLYADRAQAELNALPESPAKEALAALTDFAIARRA
jgi:octaprenyl-diphosphate synthase